MQQTTKANLYLFLISAIWGMTFPLIRNALTEINPYLFVFFRFLLAALVMLPIVWKELTKTRKDLIIHSIIFGLLNAVTYTSQTIGLQTIDSASSAFITAIYVVLVPFLAPLFKTGKLHYIDIVSSLICLFGIYVLTGADMQLDVGETWTLLAAGVFAVQITYMQRLSAKFKEYKLLTFYQLLFTTPPIFLFTLDTKYQTALHMDVIIGLVFCAIFATTLVYSLQTKYQKFTTANKASLIFATEPIFAALFGYLVNGELLTKNIILGGVLILVSLIVPISIEGLKKMRKLYGSH
jgi:drug/metabolite transporter (DMT)-like permease